jgi:hypothetical protein
MLNSYRIRTQLGVDKSVKILLDQDFEQLEILSLKILSDQIYNRQCSDYGVIVGRISINNGFGLPNCKVSIFIPLSEQDENNPIISTLYPYKSLSSVNEDGYRYNLLPYTKSYSAHVPTGSFPDREDALVDNNVIEVYDKYYKFTTQTNDSGDYMLFGVPLGSQTIHVDIDLSDIGEFSLSPQDLIRMGVATESQVAGISFKSSSNLNSLPQIVSFNRTINVDPFWGQPEVCSIGITRTDFDVSGEVNIEITPTAIFMGSIFSSNDKDFQKSNCKPKTKQGELCNLVAGPGEILAIRQTIQQDDQGRPILEVFDLESGGQVIDDNGTWLVDVPMNLDYAVTNEFGDRVLSNDPKVGIPTRGKYRFKVKWNQSPKLDESIKRAYFLLPNIREYGWDSNGIIDPLTNNLASPSNAESAVKSYAFSLDWDDYVDFQAAINCEDFFYLMSYNKVYTVSQLIDQYRKGYLPNRMISIRNILDDVCESDNVRFPTNDAIYRFDLLYLFFIIAMFIFRPILYILLVVSHLLAGVLWVFGNSRWRQIANLQLPNLSYPDCELCECKQGKTATGGGPTDFELNVSTTLSANAYITPLNQFTNYTGVNLEGPNFGITQLLSGNQDYGTQNPFAQAPQLEVFQTDPRLQKVFTNAIPMFERINLFNTKAKYFNEEWNNPGGGWNRIKVTFRPSLNPPSVKYHLDNVIVIMVKPDKLTDLPAGQIITFQNPDLSKDPNLTGFTTLNQFNTPSATGQTINQGTQLVAVPYANPNNNGNTLGASLNAIYQIDQGVDDAQNYIFPADIEYFQVITAMTWDNYISQCDVPPTTFPQNILWVESRWNSLQYRCIDPSTTYHRLNTSGVNCWVQNYPRGIRSFREYEDYNNQIVVFLVRGVDPYSTRGEVEYDLSRLFTYDLDVNGLPQGQVKVRGNYKLNVPIKGTYTSIRHNMLSDVTSNDLHTNLPLYYDSYHFRPNTTLGTDAQFTGFTSNLPSFYSALDSSTPLTYLSGADPISSYADTNTLNNIPTFLKIRDPWVGQHTNTYCGYDNLRNGFTFQLANLDVGCSCGRRWKPYELGQLLTNNTIIDSDSGRFVPSQGYYVREIVDGGTMMGQYITVRDNQLTVKAYHYSPRYSVTNNYNFNNVGTSGKIIMRSDRLPLSTNNIDNLENSYALMANVQLGIYTINDDGTSIATGGEPVGSPTFGTPGQSLEDQIFGVSVLDTFTCGGMVPLRCYYAPVTNGVSESEINVRDKPNSCYVNGIDGNEIMENGCYVLITAPIASLPKDILLLTEWTSRLQITFAACRNVWSHIFTNNWINGSLYAFSFRNLRTFNINNQPESNYCKDTIYLHPSNNFYYRSSPFFLGNPISPQKRFVGSPQPSTSTIAQLFSINSYGGNEKNLKFPTTLVDLGPRTDYIQELVYSDEYDGYVMNQMKDTTFQDVSEILNLLIINRLTNTTFLAQLFSANGANVTTYFDKRSKNFVDGDYAQMISINSELGVVELETSNYPPIPNKQDPIYFAPTLSDDPVFGIFFSSNTQTRDYISPKRTIINPLTSAASNCAFSNFYVYSQLVPFYQWEIKPSQDSAYDNIFGSQRNDWYTNRLSNQFFSKQYQSLDRLDPSSRYFRTTSSIFNKDFKGYIYSYDNVNDEYNPNRASFTPNNPQPNVITVGSPFFFYFGLKKGKTAWDRFGRKWINFENITE